MNTYLLNNEENIKYYDTATLQEIVLHAHRLNEHVKEVLVLWLTDEERVSYVALPLYKLMPTEKLMFKIDYEIDYVSLEDKIKDWLDSKKITNNYVIPEMFLEHVDNKQAICDALLIAYKNTRVGYQLSSLVYDPEKEVVVATYLSGAKKHINVHMDSGTALILDVVKHIDL